MTDPRGGSRRPDGSVNGRIGYIRLDSGDTDISRQALLLDGIGGFSRIFVEQAPAPGEAPSREKRARMLEALTAGDVIYAASADRLCTGARDLAAVAKAVRSAEADLVLLEEGVDTRTPAGRSALRLAESLARAETETASRERRNGIRRARENGRRIGRPPVAVPPNFREICRAWADGRIPGRQAAEAAGLRPTSFYSKAAELGYHAPARPKNRVAGPSEPAIDDLHP